MLTRCTDGKDGRRVLLGILPSGAQLIESVTSEVQVIYQGLSDNYGAQNMSD